ncbi:FtsX-like permease family protein [Paenibacillus sp. SN-8-1]|uniref:FtsX-like permease family protein n=1 Tax=Paenibacillus sp. SN-8-1 TaxID=3435409 RepID=UPI003D9A8B2F
MNIVNKLTIRHLKQNKRRTLVTIIGVIISVAMVTAVATLGFSFQDLMKRQSIADNGEWHVLYMDVNKEQLAAIQNDEATGEVAISKDLGYAPIEGEQNSSRPYLFVKEYNDQGFKQFGVELSKGRLPRTDKEILLSDALAEYAKVKYEIGDHLTLPIGERIEEGGNHSPMGQTEAVRMIDGKMTETLQNIKIREYTVVGFIKRPEWEPGWAPGYTLLSYVNENTIGANDQVNAAVALRTVNRSLFTHAENLAEHNKIKSVQFNNDLLHYYGVSKNKATNSMLISLTAIIMGVIIVGSVSLIYNAFAISVSERSRHLGMLASVGATRRQKRNSVFFEGFVIGLISIPIGVICGLAGIGVTFIFINSIIQGALGMTQRLTLIVTPLSLLIACAVSMLTIFISTYLPARKASRISAMDAIRQTDDIKLTGRAVRTSKLIRRLFGIEGEMGLKNLKRNKRRYHATVFSLVISIVLFLTISFFTNSLKQSLDISLEDTNYDIQVWYGNGERIDDRLVQSIRSLKDVTEYNTIHELNMEALIEEASIADELKETIKQDKSMLRNGKYPYNIRISALDDSSLRVYAKAVGADYEQLTDPSHPTAIVLENVNYQDFNTGKYVQTKAIHTKVGEGLDLVQTDVNTGKERKAGKVTFAALTDQAPMGMSQVGLGGLNLVVSERVMNQWAQDKNPDSVQTTLYLKSTDPLKTQQEIEEMRENGLQVYNVFQSRARSEQSVLLMSVFSYGFIVLISAISIANIFNTISTGVSLRKREFAMLRSVGMTPKGFTKMMNYESIFYGAKSLLFGLPLSVVVMYFVYKALGNRFSYAFTLPWMSIITVIAAVFLIVGSAMLYSSAKVKKENIIHALKQESI